MSDSPRNSTHRAICATRDPGVQFWLRRGAFDAGGSGSGPVQIGAPSVGMLWQLREAASAGNRAEPFQAGRRAIRNRLAPGASGLRLRWRTRNRRDGEQFYPAAPAAGAAGGHSRHFKLLLHGPANVPFPFNLADAAVDSFFVVSGYLITLSHERGHNLWSFYARRFFRLYPMYCFVVLAQTAIMLTMLPGGPLSEPYAALRYLAVNLALANFLQYDIGGVLAGLHNPGINPSLWTLKIELGFYLLAPPICLATRRWGWKVLAAIFAASVIYSLLMINEGDLRMAKQLPGQLQFFVTGMALYFYGERLRVRWLGSVVIAIAFVMAWTFIHPIPPGIRPLVVAAFVYSFALYTPVIRLQCDISYSVYLVHAPLLQTLILFGVLQDKPLFLAGVIVAVLSISLITERLVERPGNEFGRRLGRRIERRATVVA